MQVGLIGGIGPAATDHYYRRLIDAFSARSAKLDLTMVHADAPTLLENLEKDNHVAQIGIYRELTERLARAGADFVAITSIGGHFCIDGFKATSPLPVIDMIEAVSQSIKSQGLKKVGILGTRTVMQSRFYQGLPMAEVVAPPASLLDAVHNAYAAMAAAGIVTDAQRTVFDAACEQFLNVDGVDAVLLGGTDLALVYNEQNAEFAVVDCVAIHVEKIVESALA